VDWDNRVGAQHHIRRKKYGPIRYTEPFLNNLHITEPTLYYLKNFADVTFRDTDGVILFEVPEAKASSGSVIAPRSLTRPSD